MQQHGITSPTTLLWKSHVVLSPWVHSECQYKAKHGSALLSPTPIPV